MPLKELKNELQSLKDSELNATSVVEFRGFGQNKEYVKLVIVKDDSEGPRCPNEKLPVNNRVLKNIVEGLSAHYGKKADKKELAFLKGGISTGDYCQLTLKGTGSGLYFHRQTGEPMGELPDEI